MIFLHTIRHPLSSISSVTNNWIKFKDGIFFTPKELYYNLELIFFPTYWQFIKTEEKNLYNSIRKSSSKF